MKRRLAVVASAAAITAALGAAPATADQKPTRNGMCGAKNMMNENAGPHMVEAMAEHTAPQGDAGMVAAVGRTQCAPS